MNGKSKCKILKDIRRAIAEENDIEFVTSECKFQGECSGTCPKCEAEVRYLEEELRKRRQAGKTVAVAGVAAAMMVTAAGCTLPYLGPQGGAPLPPETTLEQPGGAVPMTTTMGILETEPPTETMGEPVMEMGEVPAREDTLIGDIAPETGDGC